MKDMKILEDLAESYGRILALEAMVTNRKVNDNGSIALEATDIPYNEEMATEFDIFGKSLGFEAAVNKTMWGRMLGRLDVFFSANADSRNAKRAADLNLLNTMSINPGPSQLKFNYNSINLYINALGYTAIRQEDLKEIEILRSEFAALMNDPENQFMKALEVYITRVIVALPMILVSIPLALAIVVVTDIMIYYYLFLSIMATFDRMGILLGGREDFTRLISAIVASVYRNGSGKSVKLDSTGNLSISDLQRITAEIKDATARMNASFLSNPTVVDYDDKVKLVQALQDNRVKIQSKYHPTGDMNRKMTSFYNIYMKNLASKHKKEVSYSQFAAYLANLSEAVSAIIENGLSCDKNLTTIVRGLYKV